MAPFGSDFPPRFGTQHYLVLESFTERKFFFVLGSDCPPPDGFLRFPISILLNFFCDA